MSLLRAARLRPVIEMAEKTEREAARQMALGQQQVAQAEAQLGQLHRYRGDYQQQWIERGRQGGVTGDWLVSYQRFLSQLETAIGQQQRSVEWQQRNLEKLREAWREASVRLEGLRKLVQRYEDEARSSESRREQRQTDEQAQRLLARRREF